MFIAVVVITTIGILLFGAKIFASSSGGDGQKVDFGGNIGSKNVRVTISKNQGKIEIEKNLFSNCAADLTGFQDEAKISGVISLGAGQKAVEISGLAGAHAENRQYFIIDKNFCPVAIAFVKDNQINYNIYSDEPNFAVQDINGDGATDITSDYRNYDLDPIANGTRDQYIYNQKNQDFEFSRSENIQTKVTN